MHKLLSVSLVTLALGCGAAARGPLAPKNPNSPVIVYTSATCGQACFEMSNHLRSRGIAHLERDVNGMPGAREEVMRKLDQAGLEASSPPVLDFRGTIVVGYQPNAIDQLCDADARAQTQMRTRAASR
jgi:hypothetical protein